jgi:hypothetical protein
MRVTTDDGQFGFVIQSGQNRRFFTFKMIVGGKVMGSSDECILGSAMTCLQRLEVVDLVQVDQAWSPPEIWKGLESDDLLSDASQLVLAESLDGWSVRGFRTGGDVVFLALPVFGASKSEVLLSLVSQEEYSAIFDAVFGFWKPRSAKG